MKAEKLKAIFQLKVRIRDIEPPVWRRVHLPE